MVWNVHRICRAGVRIVYIGNYRITKCAIGEKNVSGIFTGYPPVARKKILPVTRNLRYTSVAIAFLTFSLTSCRLHHTLKRSSS
jgi:hypothetical protein